jgi:hypothetical protein
VLDDSQWLHILQCVLHRWGRKQNHPGTIEITTAQIYIVLHRWGRYTVWMFLVKGIFGIRARHLFGISLINAAVTYSCTYLWLQLTNTPDYTRRFTVVCSFTERLDKMQACAVAVNLVWLLLLDACAAAAIGCESKPQEFRRIGVIQGTRHSSPLENETVVSEGIVTTLIGNSKFIIQVCLPTAEVDDAGKRRKLMCHRGKMHTRWLGDARTCSPTMPLPLTSTCPHHTSVMPETCCVALQYHIMLTGRCFLSSMARHITSTIEMCAMGSLHHVLGCAKPRKTFKSPAKYDRHECFSHICIPEFEACALGLALGLYASLSPAMT